jgi:hypothetical protein
LENDENEKTAFFHSKMTPKNKAPFPLGDGLFLKVKFSFLKNGAFLRKVKISLSGTGRR